MGAARLCLRHIWQMGAKGVLFSLIGTSRVKVHLVSCPTSGLTHRVDVRLQSLFCFTVSVLLHLRLPQLGLIEIKELFIWLIARRNVSIIH